MESDDSDLGDRVRGPALDDDAETSTRAQMVKVVDVVDNSPSPSRT